jgi:uncharacterized membrane protein/glutaredoxin
LKLRIVRAALLGALGVCLYLLWTSFTGSAIAGCDAAGGCAGLVQGRFGSVAGVPVSAPAIVIDLVLFVLTFWRLDRPLIRGAILLGALLLCGAAGWFIFVQVALIHHICPWCMAAHAMNVLAGGLLLNITPSATARRLLPVSAIAAAMLAGLMVVQLNQPAHDVRLVNVPGNAEAPPAISAVPLTAHPPATRPTRWLLEYDGRFKLPISDLPRLGSADARVAVVTLYDYCCPHCRKMHALLETMIQRHPRDLAVIALPMPLCDKCNVYIVTTYPGYENSCDYARLALAVFRADPAKFTKFDAWMWSQAPLPSPDVAHRYAARIVGENALAAASADPWISKQLAIDIDLYAANSRVANSWRLPQVMIGGGVAVGMPDDPRQYESLLQKYLARSP